MRKKLSLREFQEYLARRLTGAARGEVSSARLGVQSGSSQWLLDLTESGEILSLPPLTPVPLTQPWFAGLANIRGNLYAVVDFSAFCGGEPTPLNASTRLVLIGTRFGVNCAIAVNRLLGLKPAGDLRRIDDAGPQPPLVDGVLVDQDDREWRLPKVPALLADAGFMQVGLQ